MPHPDVDTTWNAVLSSIEKTISKGNYLTILKPTRLLSLQGQVATISAPSMIVVSMLEKRFRTMISEALTLHTKEVWQLSFVVSSHQTLPLAPTGSDAPLFAENTPHPSPITIGHLPRVRPDYTFINFAVSSSNQLAFTAAMAVAGKPGAMYNPLFLYGPVGVGKTHLMHAVANTVYQASPNKKIIYATSEEFTNEVIEAIGTNTTQKMKRRFRSANLLILDDVQFFEGKERVQEELFHTFNMLIDNGSQIILSSDRPPQEIKKLEKSLSSRFAGGLTVDIEPPDFALKTAILQKKAEKLGVDLPIEVAKLIAEQATDTRSLEGMLLRIMTQATLTQSAITDDLALTALGKITEGKRERLHSDDVIEAVCAFYQVKQTQLKGPKRDASIVRARQVAMYLLKIELQLPLAEIGNLLGGRDHTTIMHGVEKIEALVDNEDKLTSDIRGITKSFRG